MLWQYFHHARSLKAGEYLFEKPANIIDIEKRLRRGDVYFHTVVVPEGFTMFDIARTVEDAGLGPADDFLKVAKSETDLIADIAPNATSLEGYLFPDTYQFSRMMTMQEMAAAMVCQFRSVAKQIGLIQTVQPKAEPLKQGARTPDTLAGFVIIQTKDAAEPHSIVEIGKAHSARAHCHHGVDRGERRRRSRKSVPRSPASTTTGSPSASRWTPIPASSTRNFLPEPTRARSTTRT